MKKLTSEELKFRRRAVRRFKALNRRYQPGYAYWCDLLGVSKGTIARWLIPQDGLERYPSHAASAKIMEMQGPMLCWKHHCAPGGSGYYGVRAVGGGNFQAVSKSVGSIGCYPTPEMAAWAYDRWAEAQEGCFPTNGIELPKRRCGKCGRSHELVMRVERYVPYRGPTERLTVCQECLRKKPYRYIREEAHD